MKMLAIMVSTVVLVVSFAASAGPKMVRVEEALELSSLDITLDSTLNGYIRGKMCDTCKTIRVVITPETIAMHKRQVVPLIEAKKRAGKPAFVIFDPKTMIVKRIRWKH